jgi:Holliday junction resolvase-like predicted endonuclease
MLESFHQNKITKFLESRSFFVTKLIRTNRNGVPDLIATKGTFTVWIEVKKPWGEVSKLQSYTHRQLRKNWWIVIIPYWYDDFLKLFQSSILPNIPQDKVED